MRFLPTKVLRHHNQGETHVRTHAAQPHHAADRAGPVRSPSRHREPRARSPGLVRRDAGQPRPPARAPGRAVRSRRDPRGSGDGDGRPARHDQHRDRATVDQHPGRGPGDRDVHDDHARPHPDPERRAEDPDAVAARPHPAPEADRLHPAAGRLR